MEEEKKTLEWGVGFQKSELLVLAEKIYACKCEIRDLEWKLGDEEFHFKYIPKRKERVQEQSLARLKYIIPLGIVLAVCIWGIIYSFAGIANAQAKAEVIGEDVGLALLASLLVLIFGGYFFVKFLLIPEVSQVKLLWNSRNTEKAMQKAKQQNLDTFQKDYDESKRKIEYMKERIAKLTDEMTELTKKQDALLERKEQAEERLRREKVMFDLKPVDTKKGSFSLKEDDMAYVDLTELYEYYQKEKQYYNSYLTKLDVRLQQVNKELVNIDEKYEMAKKRLLFFAISYVLVVIIQQAFTGIAATITSIICIIVSVLVILNLESKCTPAIVNYLVEQENELIKEYAFCHNMIPVKYKRQELLEEKKKCEENIQNLIEQQKNLEVS